MWFVIKNRSMNNIFILFRSEVKLHTFVMMYSHQGQILEIKYLNVLVNVNTKQITLVGCISFNLQRNEISTY